ncbi:hypothetical protein [Methylocystis echinoides]|uniref:hypothetical protein n=1 Tax=Methylocystis echinoides TaxID=29468 RepID=UPI003436BE75
MLDSASGFLAQSVPALLWFLLFSVPPFAGWWLLFRLPLGRRRFACRITVDAPAALIWRLLDPRGPKGGFNLLHETRDKRRAPHSEKPFVRLVEEREAGEGKGRIVCEAAGARVVADVDGTGDRTQLTVLYEKPVTGLLDYELTRLALTRELTALGDAALGHGVETAPLFRFAGWRLALLGVVTGLAMAALLLAPAFYLALNALGVSMDALLATPEALALILQLAGVATLLLFGLLLAVTLIHEFGHALALAAFGHREIVISLAPFGGGVSIGAHDHADAFEAGVVGLAGPALSALAAFVVQPAPSELSELARGLASAEPDYAAALVGVARQAFVLLTLLYNIPNLLPWAGSDGARAVAALCRPGRAQQVAAGLLTALLALLFARADDLVAFGLMFLALEWFNRRPALAMDSPDSPGRRRLAVAAGLALVVGLYAHEAALLRQIDLPAALSVTRA